MHVSCAIWHAVLYKLVQGKCQVKEQARRLESARRTSPQTQQVRQVLMSHSWVQELAQEQGVQALPTVQAWKSGKCVEVRLFSGPAAQ